MSEVVAATSAVVIVASAGWAVIRNRPVALTWPIAFLSAGGALGMGILYVALAPVDLKPAAIAALGGGGAVAGLLTGGTLPLDSQPEVVVVRRVAWLGAPLAVAVAAAQVTGLGDSVDWFVLSIGGVLAAAAVMIGGWATLMRRRRRARRALGATYDRPEWGLCSKCGTMLDPTWRFCMACGEERRLAESAIPLKEAGGR